MPNTTTLPKRATISRTKFVAWSLLSLGFYQVYWAWRVWETVRRSHKANYKAKSSVRAFFMVFTNFKLFDQLKDLAVQHKYKNTDNMALLATLYLGICLLGNLPGTSVWFSVVSLVASTIVLLPVVDMHNAYVTSTKAKYTPGTINWWLLGVFAILFPTLVLLLLAIGNQQM